MKAFQRIKKINGIEYMYDITPFYDPKIKRNRQHSKYLGRVVDGKVKRIRQKLPRNAYDCGELLPFLKILEDLKIDAILNKLLPEEKARTVLLLALNRVVAPTSMMNVRSWYERTYLSKKYGELPLSPSALSEFLETIGDSAISNDFTQELLGHLGKCSSLLYDITSVSSHSKLMEMLEYGYNRDDTGLPQLNLALVAHKETGIPVAFDIYPGSINDVSTMKNTVTKLKAYGMEHPLLIMDRGFFSETNVTDIIENGFEFIMPVPFSLKAVKSLITSEQRTLENSKYLQKFEKEILFVKPVELNYGKHMIKGFLFYSIEKEKEEKMLFYERLHDTFERLRARVLRKWDNPMKLFDDIAGSMAPYIEWKVNGDCFIVDEKSNAIAQRLNRAGKMVMLYKGDYTWQQVLGWSRERDTIEKMFSGMKTELDILPLRAQKMKVAAGFVFITFISLILRSRILALMKERNLYKNYGLPALILELSKIRRVELSDGSFMTTEVTKKQRSILEALEINIESLCA